jgi:hypothetical protein
MRSSSVIERADGGPGVDRQQPARVPKQGLEADGVELRRLGPESVARSAPLEPLGSERLRRCEA